MEPRELTKEEKKRVQSIAKGYKALTKEDYPQLYYYLQMMCPTDIPDPVIHVVAKFMAEIKRLFDQAQTNSLTVVNSLLSFSTEQKHQETKLGTMRFPKHLAETSAEIEARQAQTPTLGTGPDG